jgi:hypothetical protein
MDTLRGPNLYGKIKLMTDGPPTTDDFAKKIGGDFRGRDAYEGVEQARYLVSYLRQYLANGKGVQLPSVPSCFHISYPPFTT